MKILLKFTTDTLAALNLLQRHEYYTQLLVVLYSAIDTLAWTSLVAGDVTEKAFVNWVDLYMLPNTPLSCTSQDLYAARCGLVHSHAAISRRSKQGRARQIWYYGKGQSDNLVFKEIDSRTDVIAVRLVDLILAFGDAGFRYAEDIIQNPEASMKVQERASQWLHWVSHD